MKEFICKDCGHKIEVSDGVIILECKPCGAIYAGGRKRVVYRLIGRERNVISSVWE
jgi:ribosomal protein L37AE/L43A